MNCQNCGCECIDGTKFCKKCGTKLASVAVASTQEAVASTQGAVASTQGAVASTQEAVASTQGNVEKSKGLNKKMLLVACLAIVAVIVFFVMSGKNTINLNDYLSIDVSGYDGYGSASATINWDAIEADYGDELLTKNGYTAIASQALGASVPIEFLKYSVSAGCNPASNLSNGDIITYSWTVDSTVFQYIDCELVYASCSYTVDSLEKIDEFDAFADVDVAFSGFDEQASATLVSTGETVSLRYFQCDTMKKLANGDIIEVYINESDVARIAESAGKVPQALSKEYVVSGLLGYIKTADELSTESVQTLQARAKEVYETYVIANQEWGEETTLASFEYLGNYLLTPKDSDNQYNNILFMVYKPVIETDFHYEGESFYSLDETYWYVYFCDVAVDADGTVDMDAISRWYVSGGSIELESEIRVQTYRVTHDKEWEYTGYRDYQDLYDTIYETSTVWYDEYYITDNVTQ